MDSKLGGVETLEGRWGMVGLDRRSWSGAGEKWRELRYSLVVQSIGLFNGLSTAIC